MLLFVAFISVLSSQLASGACPAILAQDVPCITALDKCYCFSFRTGTWAQANEICRSNPNIPGARLVSIESQEENDLILYQISNFPGLALNNEDGFWTSGSDGTTEGTWLWTANGDYLTYTHWYAGQPDNGGEQDCLQLHKPFGYQWDDARCDRVSAFICESPIPAWVY